MVDSDYHLFAIFSQLGLFDDHNVTINNISVFYGVTADTQRVGIFSDQF